MFKHKCVSPLRPTKTPMEQYRNRQAYTNTKGIGRDPFMGFMKKDGTENFNFIGGTMEITYDRFENTEAGAGPKKYKMVRVYGTKDDGTEYSTQFFASNKDLKGQVEGLTKGSRVNVKLKKNGQYWNPVGFETIESPKAQTPQVSGGGACACNPRLDNLKVAIEILGNKAPDIDDFEYLEGAAALADLVNDYVNEAGAFQFQKDTSEGIPEEEEDEIA